jgi:hypothetical protein
MQGKFCIFHFVFLVIIDLANEKLGLLIKKKDILIKKKGGGVWESYIFLSARVVAMKFSHRLLYL